jgi:hypothetical protein
MITRFVALATFCLCAASACGSSSDGTSTGTQSELVAIGSPCTTDSQCGTGPAFMCMVDHPGGYCSRHCDIKNGDADCPAESICQFDGTNGECHRKCAVPSDCRAGYVCSPASSVPSNRASHAFCDMAPDDADGGTT